MHAAFEGLDLLEQGLDQLLRGANRNAGNVVNRLVRIEFGALTTGLSNGIDNLRFQAEESELEDLEQAAGSGTDNDNIRNDH
jgi:hypothetical protein